jgi:hypothetical protein
VAGARLNRRWHLTSYFCELLPAERLALCKRSDVRGGSIASLWPSADYFWSSLGNGHRQGRSARLTGADIVEIAFLGWRSKFPKTADAFRARRYESPHRLISHKNVHGPSDRRYRALQR